ncbi:MAG: hypothetical protein AAGA92_11850, partial [Planctomycetota bacterium]
MSQTAMHAATETTTNKAPLRVPPETESPQRGFFLRATAAAVRFGIGVVLCQGVLTAVLVVGWAQRWLERRVYSYWWRRSPARDRGLAFDDYLSRVDRPISQPALPRWITADPSNTPASRRVRWFGSLVANFGRGLPAAANAFLWLLPATALWYVAWVLGWNISFHKLYEQSPIGATLGVSGVALFAALLLYLPVALARQAVTADPRRFYDLRLNWLLTRNAAWGGVQTAAFAAAVGSVVMVLRIAPYFLGGSEEIAALPPAQQLAWLKSYYLAAGIVVLGGYLLTWLLAARVYAAAALRAFLSGAGPKLTHVEQNAFASLGYQPTERAETGSPLWKTSRSFAGGGWTAAGLAAASLAWVAVATEVFVGQFFHYIPGLGWLNHPLLVLPYFKYLPPGL